MSLSLALKNTRPCYRMRPPGVKRLTDILNYREILTVADLQYRVSGSTLTAVGLLSVACPMARNSVPDFIWNPTSSTHYFRGLLKTYLFMQYQCIECLLGVINDNALYKFFYTLAGDNDCRCCTATFISISSQSESHQTDRR